MNYEISNNVTPKASTVVITKRRLLLFLATYFIAAMITTGLIVYPSTDDFPFVFTTFNAAMVFLPCGLILALNRILSC